MATLIANKKNGKVVSYRFRTYMGQDASGKTQYRFTTWKIPEGLTPAKAKKAALKAALSSGKLTGYDDFGYAEIFRK